MVHYPLAGPVPGKKNAPDTGAEGGGLLANNLRACNRIGEHAASPASGAASAALDNRTPRHELICMT
jgi:hypothetical protein